MLVGSAHGQDEIVLRLLGGRRGGYFLDSGASDGIEGSNTWRLEVEYGWTGICVEPNDAFFERLVRNRCCHCVNVCLYDREGEVDFVEADMLGGILSEYHPRLLDLATTTFGIPAGPSGGPVTIVKEARTVRAVLREHEAPRVIDYWSLDTEGSELAILRSFPWDEYTVRVITVEHNGLPVREPIRELLEAQGYRRVADLFVDDCYVKDVALPGPGWRSRAWRRG